MRKNPSNNCRNLLIVLSLVILLSAMPLSKTQAQEDLEPSLILHHDNWVNGAWWNRDDTSILSWSVDGTARLWDAQTGEELLTMTRDDSDIRWASWNSDESLILTATLRDAQVWDGATGEHISTLDYGEVVSGVWPAWNKAGTHILIWTYPFRLVNVWDVATGEVVLNLGPAITASWNDDESRIAAALHSGVQVWDAATGAEIITLEPEQPVTGVMWLDTSRLLINYYESARVWDVERGRQLFAFQGLGIFMLNRDKSRILSWAEDGETKVFDAATGEVLLSLYPGSGEEMWFYSAKGARWNSDETRIISWAAGDNRVRVWDAQTGEELLSLPQLESFLRHTAWNSSEDYIVTLVEDATEARVWDAESGEWLYTLSSDHEMQGAWWSRNGSRVLGWGKENTLRIWDIGE